jgi:hypothetical protein
VKDGKPVAGAQVVLMQKDHSSEHWLGKLDIATNEDGFSAGQPVVVGDDKTNIDAGTLTIGRSPADIVVAC